MWSRLQYSRKLGVTLDDARKEGRRSNARSMDAIRFSFQEWCRQSENGFDRMGPQEQLALFRAYERGAREMHST